MPCGIRARSLTIRAGTWICPIREGVLSYLAAVLARQCQKLGSDIRQAEQYYYELAIRHEDMHAEALAYMRQTLGYAQPVELGMTTVSGAEAYPGDVEAPGGRWQLGSTAKQGFIFDNEKWAHEVKVEPFKIAKAPVTNAEFAAFVEEGGYRRQEFWSDAGWAWRSARALSGLSIGSTRQMAHGAAAVTIRSRRCRPMRR